MCCVSIEPHQFSMDELVIGCDKDVTTVISAATENLRVA